MFNQVLIKLLFWYRFKVCSLMLFRFFRGWVLWFCFLWFYLRLSLFLLFNFLLFDFLSRSLIFWLFFWSNKFFLCFSANFTMNSQLHNIWKIIWIFIFNLFRYIFCWRWLFFWFLNLLGFRLRFLSLWFFLLLNILDNKKLLLFSFCIRFSFYAFHYLKFIEDLLDFHFFLVLINRRSYSFSIDSGFLFDVHHVF